MEMHSSYLIGVARTYLLVEKTSVDDFISQAEGYLELEMFEEAWDAIDELPPEERANPKALRVRMFAAFAIGRHGTAEVLARLLSATESPERKAAGFILSQLAGIHLAAGDEGKAKESVKAAICADQDIKLAILDDPDLQALSECPAIGTTSKEASPRDQRPRRHSTRQVELRRFGRCLFCVWEAAAALKFGVLLASGLGLEAPSLAYAKVFPTSQ